MLLPFYPPFSSFRLLIWYLVAQLVGGISKVVRNFQECLKQKEYQIQAKSGATHPSTNGRQQVSRPESDAKTAV